MRGLGRPCTKTPYVPSCGTYVVISFCWVLFWGLIHPLPLLAADSTQVTPQQKVSQEISALQQKLKTLEQARIQKRLQSKSIEQQIAQIDLQLNTSHKNSREISLNIKQTQTQLTQLNQRLHALEQEKQTQQQQLYQLIRASFAAGRQEYLKLLLNQQSPETLGRLLSYYRYFNRARTTKIEQLNRLMGDIQKTQDDIRGKLNKADQLEIERQVQKQNLREQKKQREELLQQIKQQIAQQGQSILDISNDISSLEQVLSTVKGTLTVQSFSQRQMHLHELKGKLRWPVVGPILRQSSALEGTSGVIIRAKEGTPVRAIHTGRVVFANWLRGFGLLVIVDHGDDYMSLYGHNSSVLKSIGDWVEAGETIAEVGSSGGQVRSGLFFDVRFQGAPLALKPWFK